MAEEARYKRNEEEVKIDSLNKSQSSEFMQLFMLLCSILGYALILSFAVCCFLLLESLVLIADSSYANGVPKANIWKEYFIYVPSLGVSLFMIFSMNNYLIFVRNNGLKNIVSGLRTKILKRSVLCFLIGSVYVVLFLLSIEAGLNLFLGEIILFGLGVSTAIYLAMRYSKSVISSIKPYLGEEKRIELNKKNKTKVIVKGKGFKFSSGARLFGLFFMLLFCTYYVFVTILVYRSSSNIMQGVISLVVHPLLFEVILTGVRLGVGNDAVTHPYYLHVVTFTMEAIMNVFRRFLFHDTSSINMTLILVFVSGVEEVLARSYMEKKEIWLRKMTGNRKLTEIELISKRKYYAHSVTARSILELVSIIVVPVMVVLFSSNRFTFDLGYNGLEPVDVKSIFFVTMIQLVVELLVCYLCSIMELMQKISVSDFFFHFRSGSVFISHFLSFTFGCNWILHNMKTLPTKMFCFDINDPCSCPSFLIYKSVCESISSTVGNSSSASNVTLILENSGLYNSSYNLNNTLSLYSIVGVLLIFLMSYMIIAKLKYSKSLTEEIIAAAKTVKFQQVHQLADSVTNTLIEKSSLNRAILTIETLCRGLPPSQAALLKNIIQILKYKKKSRNSIDIKAVLENSSSDEAVVNFLNQQLTTFGDQQTKTFPPISKRSFEKSFLIEQKTIRKLILDSLGVKLPFSDCLSWDFDFYSFKGKITPSSFISNCLNNSGLIEKLNFEKERLSNMILFVDENYSLVNYDSYLAYGDKSIFSSVLKFDSKQNENSSRGNAYHNNFHGADVFQAVLYFSTTYKDIGGDFTSLDLFSVLFAAYIHDFNHPGLNTTYMISDWPSSGISSTFGTESPLEKHHLAMTFNLMRNADAYNFLINFSTIEVNIFQRIVTECVLATDLAKSMPWLASSRIAFNDYLKIENGNNNSIDNPISIEMDEKATSEKEKKDFEIKLLKMQLSIKCADVSHPARLTVQHIEWSSLICEEFYLQGDKERSKGMKISPLCDRNVPLSQYPQAQIGFINYVCRPCFNLLNEVCHSASEDEKPWLKNINSNIEYWEERKRESNLFTGAREIKALEPVLSDSESLEIHQREIERVDNLNQDEASDVIHLFLRACSIFGYCVLLSFFLVVYIYALSFIDLTNIKYPDSLLPKTNLITFYFTILLVTFCFGGFYAILNVFISLVTSNGMSSLIFTVALIKYCCFIALCMTGCMFLISSFTLLLGVDIFIGEAVIVPIILLLLGFISLKLISEIRTLRTKLKLSRKSKDSSGRNERKGGKNFRIFLTVTLSLVIFFFIYYYPSAILMMFRNSDQTLRFVIALVIHPFFVEVLMAIVRLSNGKNKIIHPFFDQFSSFILESTLNLFRRFMFNNIGDDNITLVLVIFCGIQEIIIRSTMEWKEVTLRKLMGSSPLTEEQLVIKRKFYSYAVTARSILEIISIIISPVMFVCFFDNRFAVDFGYGGIERINFNSILVSTIIQVLIELMTIYACSMIELRQNIPMSDFFYHYRSQVIFYTHFIAFAGSSSYTVFVYKTVPSSLLCSDIMDPCSCPSFTVYTLSSLCSSNSTVSNSINEADANLNSLYRGNDSAILIAFIAAVLCIVSLSFIFIFRKRNFKNVSSTEYKNPISAAPMDETTKNIMEQSSLQQVINTIETLSRGVSTSQAKLLKNVIEILKKQNEDGNSIDIAGVLKDSSDDKTVVNWLNQQLTSNNDKEISRPRSTILQPKINQKKIRRSIIEIDEKKKIKVDNPESEISNIHENNNEKANSPFSNCLSWDFNVLSFKGKITLSSFVFHCFNNSGFIEELKLGEERLSNILIFIDEHYSLVNYDSYLAYGDKSILNSILKFDLKQNEISTNGNPYHNNFHGADVFQAVLYFSTTYKDIGGDFTSLDLFSVLFAAYIHDFNHPGLNTTYMISDWPSSGISSTFGTESPLEKHHLATTFNLMRNADAYNFLINFSTIKVNIFQRIVTECVLATDLAKSMPWLASSRIAFNDYLKTEIGNNSVDNPISIEMDEKAKSEKEKKDFEIKLLKMQLLIKCADVSHPARSTAQHIEWSSLICEEFYLQGDKERSKGMEISPLCDRNVPLSLYPQSQICFINYVCRPCFNLLNEVCHSASEDEKPWLKNINSNIEYWEGWFNIFSTGTQNELKRRKE